MKSWLAQARLFKLGLLALTISLVLCFALIPNSLYTSIEQLAYDRVVVLTTQSKYEKRLLLVDINEQSLHAIGPWPWPRSKVAELIEQLLNQYHVALIGIDIVFPESKPDDELLAKVLNQPSVVMSQVLDFSANSQNQSGKLVVEKQLLSQQDLGQSKTADKNHLPEMHGYIANHQRLLTANSQVGHISPLIDQDGKVRRVYPLACNGDGCSAMLSLKMYQALHQGLDFKIHPFANHLSLNIANQFSADLPLDNEQAMLIPFHIRAGGFRYISAADILLNKANAEELNNSVVIVGSTALGLGDFVATPISNIVPGLEIHGQLLAGILDDSLIQTKQHYLWVLLPLMLIALLYILIPLRSAKDSILWIIAMMILIISGQLILLRYLYVLPPITPPILMVLMLGFISILHDNILVNRQLAAVAEQFSRFIPDALVKRLIRGKDLSRKTKQRELTVLVADMRGFTSAAEGKSPEQVAKLAQKCLATLTQEVYRFGGTIEKFSGDGLMAIWGAPQRDPQHAQHAFQAGLAMQAEIGKMSDWFAEHGFPNMKVSVGINTGDMAVGLFGGESHLAWSAHGDAVNVASRIEQLTRTVGKDLLLGARTAQLIGLQSLSFCGEFKVKGRQESVAVYSPSSEISTKSS